LPAAGDHEGGVAVRLILPATLAAVLSFDPASAAPLLAPALAPDSLLRLAAVEEPSENATDFFFDDEFQRQQIVSRVQEVLADLGIYGGPIDGSSNAATDRAIRVYQDQVNLPVDGRATRQLLDHLETVGRANRLIRKIAEVKARHIDEARKALAGQAATRGLLGDGAVETADATRDSAAYLATPSPSCLLDEALESAKAVADDKFRDWAYGDIVVAQAKTGLSDDAFRTAARIEDPRLIIAALRNIAQAEAAAGRLNHASTMAGMVPDPWSRIEALASIAFAEAQAGDPQAALVIVQSIGALAADVDRPQRVVAALAKLVVTLEQAEAPAASRAAFDLAEKIVASGALAGVDAQRGRSEVAAALAQSGDPDTALETARQLSDAALRRPILLAVARAHARSGANAEALSVAETVPDPRYRSVAFSDIALSMARHGDAAGARALIERALADSETIDERFTYAKGFALSRAALALAEMASHEEAIAAASLIKDHGLRAKTQWAIAAAQRHRGRGAEADASFALARRSAHSVKSTLDRVWTFGGMASASARAGDGDLARDAFEQARAIAATIESAWARANALTKLATTLLDIR
jgi:peptidoglycan hydrolase-like protein with peptidoglycan-binding domain